MSYEDENVREANARSDAGQEVEKAEATVHHNVEGVAQGNMKHMHEATQVGAKHAAHEAAASGNADDEARYAAKHAAHVTGSTHIAGAADHAAGASGTAGVAPMHATHEATSHTATTTTESKGVNQREFANRELAQARGAAHEAYKDAAEREAEAEYTYQARQARANTIGAGATGAASGSGAGGGTVKTSAAGGTRAAGSAGASGGAHAAGSAAGAAGGARVAGAAGGARVAGSAGGAGGGASGVPHNAQKNNKGRDSQYVTKGFLAVVIIIAMIISAVAGGLIGAGLMTYFQNANDHSSSSITNNTESKTAVTDVVEENKDAVVEIFTTVTQKSFFGEVEGQGAGSGVIVKDNGYIVTNYHVIEGSKSISVRLHNGEEHAAQVVGYDQQNDIAVLKIDGKNYDAAEFGDSAKLNVGDVAIAIGNPLGELGGTATVGIISATDRQIVIDNQTLTLLQTDASINPGNSGGGLFNSAGKLIGIVVAKSSGDDVEGLGFAIPIDTAKPIIEDIIENGKISNKPAAGIVVVEVPEDMIEQYGVSEPGVYISEVTGENAKKAGLKAGDRLLEFDNEKIESSTQLVQAIQKHKIGDKVKFTVSRDGKTQTIEFKLQDSSSFN